jgi:hypothetical protein
LQQDYSHQQEQQRQTAKADHQANVKLPKQIIKPEFITDP